MSYIFIVIGPKKVETKLGYKGFTSSTNPMIGAMYGDMLDEFENSKKAIVESITKRHKIKTHGDLEIRSVRVDNMPSQNKEAYAALAKQIAKKENVADHVYHWDALMWDTPMFSFPTLVMWVLPIEVSNQKRQWWKFWS